MGSHEAGKITNKGDTFIPLDGGEKDAKAKKTAPAKKPQTTDSISSAKDDKKSKGGASAKDTLSSAKDDSKKIDTDTKSSAKKAAKAKKEADSKKSADADKTDSKSSAKKDDSKKSTDADKKAGTDSEKSSDKSLDKDIDKALKEAAKAKDAAIDETLKTAKKAGSASKKESSSSHEPEESDAPGSAPKPQGCCAGQDRLSHWFSGAGTCMQLLFIFGNIVTAGLLYLGSLAGFHFFGEDQI